MAVLVRSLLAKDWQVDVDLASNPTAPTWAQIKGLHSMTEQVTESEIDDSDFDGGGYASAVPTQRKVDLALTSARKKIVQTGFADDPGQAFVRAQGRMVGYAAAFFARYYRKDGAPDAYYGEVHAVGVGGGGGAVIDLEMFSPTLKFHGQPASIINPLNTPSVPILTSIIATKNGGTTFLVAGGDIFRITGSAFTGTVSVSIAGNLVAAGSWYVEDDNHIVGVAPAHVAGTALPVVVTNAVGASTSTLTVTYA